ncbi:bacteriocin fulvocin C-related protein [Arsukibacterium perlucidum]|uniref:bacteriocin fulvocin C-related protein n=1 Tax=Arsukibacterium perlucidum TaxID=368811 RepID=UPI0012FCC9AF|nr:bacteriocin fulvocin C-related protein [Arsukibacterium perlucidum]
MALNEKATLFLSESIYYEPYSLYEEFSRLKIMSQRSAYSKMKSHQRIALWQEHFRRFSEFHSLTNEQVNFISILNKKIIALHSNDSTSEKNEQMVADTFRMALNHFTQEVAENLMSNLGVFSTFALDNNFTQDVNDNCSCSRSSDMCGINSPCRRSFCMTKSFGCGLLWVFSCDGKCAGMQTQ